MFKEKTCFFFWLCFCLLIGVFAGTDAVKSVSVMEGDSVFLNSDTEIKDDDVVEWRFGTSRTLLAKMIRELDEIYISNSAEERFRDRLKLDDQTGSLTITNTRTTDSGLYEVTISGSNTTFTVTVYAATTPDPPSTSHPTSDSPSSSPSCFSSGPPSGSPSGSTSGPHSGPPSGPHSGPPSGPPDSMIVLISAAAAGSLLLIAVVVIFFFICRKHKKTDQQAETREEEITYADPTFYKRNRPKMGVKEEDEVIYAKVITRR